jgi:hypothetical protein
MRYHHGIVKKISVQVRSGHILLTDTRDFRDVVTTKQHGYSITLEPPTDDKIKSARVTDPYISSLQIEYLNLQIITVRQILEIESSRPAIMGPFEKAVAVKRSRHKLSKLL